jgi:hypothetical protein
MPKYRATARAVVVGILALAGMALTEPAAQAGCINVAPIVPPAFGDGAGLGCELHALSTSVDVLFAFASAADLDSMLFDHPGAIPGNPIIVNRLTPLGTDVHLTVTKGQTLGFIFNDLTSFEFANAVNGGPPGFNNAAVATPPAPGAPDNSEGYLNATPNTAADGIAHTAYAILTTGAGPVTSASASLFCADSGPGSGACKPAGRRPVTLSASVVTAMNKIDNNSSDWLLVGFEDRLNRVPGFPQTDLDFNDLIFALHNVGPVIHTPEPVSFALLGVGLVGLGLVRRKR